MFKKNSFKDILRIVFSNAIKLFSSVALMFLVPLIFSESNFSYYKLFTLYVSYAGIFNFGLIDGIYLHYAGRDLDDLPENKFKNYTKIILFVSLLGIIPLIVYSFFISGDKLIIMLFFIVNIIFINLMGYFQFISQITSRFKEYSLLNIINTTLNLVGILVMFFLKLDNYIILLSIMTIINVVLTLWYMYKYRKFVSFKKTDILGEEIKKSVKDLYKLGIPLLVSNFIIIIISNFPKQFVEWKFPIEDYPSVFGNFSFAFTLLGFASVFLSAISVVLYPILNKSNEESLKKSYNDLNAVVLALVFVLLVAYYPLVWIVQRYLSNYTDSLKYFYVLAPGIALTASISVIKHNYYKALNKNKTYLIIGLITLILQVIITFVLFEVFNQNIIVVAIITVVTQAIWCLITEVVLNKKLGVYSIKNNIYIVVSTIAFYLMKLIGNIYIEFAVYGVVIIIITGCFYFKEIKGFLASLKSRRENSKKEA